MLLTHLGHSCLLVEAAGSRILFDPGTLSQGFEGLTDLDAVCITHQHQDHLDLDRLTEVLAAGDDVRLLAEPETADLFRATGTEVVELRPGGTVDVGAVRIDVVGGRHAVVHPGVPQIGNVGLVVSADGEPTVFHPGDSYETAPGPALVPDGVDVLAWPLNAPWAALRETIDFVDAVRPRFAVPVHDALLSPVGRAAYLRIAGTLLPEGTTVLDLAGEPATAL
jgi:L-ascorbate metabolism protein UlaG (beta-lactamase superfamily)